MKRFFPFFAMACILAVSGCFTTTVKPSDDALTAQIDTSSGGWRNDVPLTSLKKIKKFFHEGIGRIDNNDDFELFWECFRDGNPRMLRPAVDFENAFVVMAYSPQFYNICQIIGVDVNRGIAVPIIRSTRTSMKIQDKVYMSVVVMPREGVLAVRSDDRTLKIDAIRKD